MDFSKTPILTALTQKMAWLNRRQRVLAQNVANADTPNYVPRDLEQPDFKALLKTAGSGRLKMLATTPGHVAGVAGGTEFLGKRDDVKERSPNGNSVDLTEQMMKMGKTQMDYSITSNLYRKQINLIRLALGRGR